MKRDRLASTLSSVFFFVPAYVAFDSGRWFTGACFITLVIVSTLYHYNKPRGFNWWWEERRSLAQNIFLFFDVFFGLVTFVTITASVFSGNVNPMSITGLVLFAVSFIVFNYIKRNFEFFHSLWHFIVAMTSVLILLSIK